MSYFATHTHHSLFQTPIRIYSSYRLLLAIIFLSIILSSQESRFGWPLAPAATVVIVYFTLALSFFISSIRRSTPIIRHTFIGFVIDILFIALLEYSTIQSGIALDLILIVSVAAGSIVFTGPLGTAIAAIATIFLCTKELVLDRLLGSSDGDTLKTALLGLTFFATSWITQNLAKKIKESEIVTTKQASNIEHLQHLNDAIIERMRTGVVVFNAQMQLEMMNDAANRLLTANSVQPNDPSIGLKVLQMETQSWLSNSIDERQTIQLTDQSPEIKLGFTFLKGEQQIVVFLEDNTKVRQHAQQLKLASLGQLTASIAHEIRNPLAAVSYASQLLQETQPSSKQRKLIDIVLKHVIRMNDIVNNVLQISRREPPNSIDILLKSWMIDYTHAVFEEHMQQQTLHIQIEDTLIIEFDPSHLAQVCTNVLENSLHAIAEQQLKINMAETRQKPLVSIKAYFIENIGRVALDIHDNGKGITAEQLPHLFEPFFSTSINGSGLGLFLCREICELNHARIHFLPVDQGTCLQILFKPRNLNGNNNRTHR